LAAKRRQFGRVRRLPSGRYQARYPDGSGRDWAAPSTFPTKADATAFLARTQADMQRGEWRDIELGQVTFRSWAEQWLEANPAKRATSLARDRVVLQTHFFPALGDRPLNSITRVHVKGCFDAMVAKLAPATVRTNLGVLNAVLNAAVDAELIARSPGRGIRMVGGPSRERPTLTLGELSRLAEEVPGEYRALILVAGIMGLRWSEAVGLRVGDVDFLRRTLAVRQTIAEVEGRLLVAETKSRSSRRTLSVPRFLTEELAEHLARHRPGAIPTDLVFTNPEGGPLRRYFAERVFNPAVKRAGLDPALTFHGLRHVATSLSFAQGEHPRVIQARLGHATARLSMELYAHVPEATDRDVATHLDERWKASQAGTDRARSGHDDPRTKPLNQEKSWSERVEVTGFEPATSTMRTSRSSLAHVGIVPARSA
jgi:integrase